MEIRGTFIVDTNVPIIGNLTNRRFSKKCATACGQVVLQIIKNCQIVLDDHRLILSEYIKNCRTKNHNMLSDIFLKWVLTYQENGKRCVKIKLTVDERDECKIDEFLTIPELQLFHRKDRKFIAVSCTHKHHPPIIQAGDSRWWGHRKILEQHGISVIFLCKSDIIDILKKKGAKKRPCIKH